MTSGEESDGNGAEQSDNQPTNKNTMTQNNAHTDETTTDYLEKSHVDVDVDAPQWALDTLIFSAEQLAADDDIPDNIRRDCDSAATILRLRMNESNDVDEKALPNLDE